MKLEQLQIKDIEWNEYVQEVKSRNRTLLKFERMPPIEKNPYELWSKN